MEGWIKMDTTTAGQGHMELPESSLSPAKPTRIDHDRDGHKSYLIAPENRDLFIRTGKQVIAACDMQIRIERWIEVYEAMLGSVRDFAQDHAELVSACYAVPRNAKTVLSFIPKTDSFNFELANELAKLQFDFQQRFVNLVGAIEIGQIPSWDLDRFLDVRAAEKIYPIN
jgi:hypothetical protein